MTQEHVMFAGRPRMRSIETNGPHPGFGEKMMLFGQFVGTWQYESQYFLHDGNIATACGEIHFGWILDGMAVQDTMTGVIHNPPKGLPRRGFGTMLRFYDSKIDAWHCTWIGPSVQGGGVVQRFVARKIKNEIVLEGTTTEGNFERWIFSDVKHNSFNWRAEESRDKGETWRLDQRIQATRITTHLDRKVS